MLYGRRWLATWIVAGTALGAGLGGPSAGWAQATQGTEDPREEPTGTVVPHWDRVTLDLAPMMVPIGFYGFRVSLPMTDRGRALVGYMYQNFENDLGQPHAHTLLVGYQYFLWRGLQVEAELWPSYNRWHSAIDGQDYRGFDLWAEARIGYRFDFTTRGLDWLLLPQLLYGRGVWRSYDAPGDFSDPFVFPVFWIGFPL